MTSSRMLALATALVLIVSLPTSAAGQEAQAVEGTADHRPAPLLGPGQYTDTIVTGETVWYAVLYTNNEPFRVEVGLEGVDLEGQDELSLEASFVGPTLGSVSTGRVLEGTAQYSGTDTNLWYIQVTLDTTGRRGIEHTLLADISGVEAAGFEDCTEASGCALADDLADAQARLEQARQGGGDDEGGGDGGAGDGGSADDATIEDQIQELEDAIEDSDAELQAAEEEIAQLCSPEVTCDTVPASSSGTPLWAWLVAGVLLAGGGGLLAVQLGRRERRGTT